MSTLLRSIIRLVMHLSSCLLCPTKGSRQRRDSLIQSCTTDSVAQCRTSTSCRSWKASSSSTSSFVSISSYASPYHVLCRAVLKTNFYQPTKVALSFRLAPDFLPDVEYPKKPFGMFIVIGRSFCGPVEYSMTHTLIGNEFRGFHIRFRDVARGGIRIVMSRNKEWVSHHELWRDGLPPHRTYSINQRQLYANRVLVWIRNVDIV